MTSKSHLIIEAYNGIIRNEDEYLHQLRLGNTQASAGGTEPHATNTQRGSININPLDPDLD